MKSSERIGGSASEFDKDWRDALELHDDRFLIFPSEKSGRIADTLEWIKAQQIIGILNKHGVRTGAILEYGCGAAGISLYLASKGYNCYICDLSIHAIKLAQMNRKYHNLNIRNLQGTVADAIHLPYETNSLDVVMSYGLLEHFEMNSLNRLISETTRVLKPGGLYIADIVPGPERMNVRTLGIFANYLGSLIFHFATGKWSRIPKLFQSYFDFYYESAFDDNGWLKIFNNHDLENVKINVCRPFPPMAFSGSLERLYSKFILHFQSFHNQFDRTNNWFTRHWGWMYLVQAQKPKEHPCGSS